MSSSTLPCVKLLLIEGSPHSKRENVLTLKIGVEMKDECMRLRKHINYGLIAWERSLNESKHMQN